MNTLGNYNLSIYDDYGRAQLCIDTTTGAFLWTVLSGPNAGKSYTGTLNVLNAGTLFQSKPGDPTWVYATYNPNLHTGQGFLVNGLVTSSLYDSNTTNNPPCP